MSSSTVPGDQLLLAANPKLSQADLALYHTNKAKLFKFTIAICVIYGVCTLTLLLLSVISPRFRAIFGENIRPFITTFVICMVIIIVILVFQIIYFKPTVLTSNIYDNDVCPDFWQLVPTSPNDPIYRNAASNVQGLLQYHCKPNTNVWLPYNLMDTTSRGSDSIGGHQYYANYYGQKVHLLDGSQRHTVDSYTDIDYKTVFNTSNITNIQALQSLVFDASGNANNGYMTSLTNNNSGTASYGNIGSSNLLCSRLYPSYLGTKNATDSKFNSMPNTLNCTMAEACGIPWTNLCGK